MDESYQFMFSLYRGDCFRVWKTPTQPGPLAYLTSFDRNGVKLTGNRLDRSNRAEGGAVKPERFAITTAHRIEKFEVTILGDLYPVRREPRP